MSIVHFDIAIESVKEKVAMIEPFLRSIPIVHELPEQTYYNALIILTEAVNNAILHGNRCDVTKHVFVSVDIHPEHLAIEVRDEGEGFDADAVPDPRRRENILKDGGRGVFLIKALSHEAHFLNTGSGTSVRMIVPFPSTHPDV